MDPDTLDSQQPARDEVTGEMIGKVYKESRVPPPAADRTGLKAAQTALELLRSTSDPPAALMTETLIELGDWFQATSRPAISIPYYAEAAAIFDAQTAADPLAGHPLKAPRMVFYRPPLSASRGLNTLSGQYVIRKTVFSFLVSETGVPLDITVVSTDMDEGQLSQSQRAVGKAIYSPRFAEGQAVSTAGVTFTSEWYQEYDPENGARRRAADLHHAARTRGCAAARPRRSRPQAPDGGGCSAAGGVAGGGSSCGWRLFLGWLVFRRLLFIGRGRARARRGGLLRRRLQHFGRRRRRRRQRAARAAQQEAHRVLVGQLDRHLGAGVAHRALGRDRERFLARERARLLAPVSGERERVDPRAAAVVDRQQVADRDDEGLPGHVLRRQERVLLELRLEHERERRRDVADARSGRRRARARGTSPSAASRGWSRARARG